MPWLQRKRHARRTNQDDDDVATALRPDLVDPARRVQERLPVWRTPPAGTLSRLARGVCGEQQAAVRAWSGPHLTRRTRRRRQTSPGCSWGSGCGSAPALPCPCRSTGAPLSATAVRRRVAHTKHRQCCIYSAVLQPQRTIAAAGPSCLPGTLSLTGSRFRWSPARSPRQPGDGAPRSCAPPRHPPRLIGVVKLVVHEARDDAGLAHGLVAEEHLRGRARVSAARGVNAPHWQHGSAPHAGAPAYTLRAATRWRRSPWRLRPLPHVQVPDPPRRRQAAQLPRTGR